jgi:hypothetical protein
MIPDDDPLLLQLRGQRARLECGETPERVYSSSAKPHFTAAVAVIYLKHIELGDRDVLVKQVSDEASNYLAANHGQFGYRRGT